jgi:uncharacterized delta-60 repeat protein
MLLTLSLAVPAHSQQLDFSVPVTGPIWSLALQSDGKILLGGLFGKIANQTFQNIGRLNADGTVDDRFSPAGARDVTALAALPEGKVVVGGYLTNLAGQISLNIARLNSDGTADASFSPGIVNDIVWAFAAQPDGKIILAGPFTVVNSQRRKFICRLNSDGALDQTFNPTGDINPFGLIVQPDGKILAGGFGGIERLNSDGSADSAFNASVSGQLYSMALQPDGKVLVSFKGRASGLTNTATGRLNSDGTLDSGFNSAIRGTANSLTIQADGKILVLSSALNRLNPDGSLDAGFDSPTNLVGTSLGLQSDGKILVDGHRLNNTGPASQALSYEDTTITWLRRGTSPEVCWTTFDYSANGLDWIRLGTGTRIPGGWQLANATLPSGYTLRARGGLMGGYCNDSFWFVESAIGRPLISSQPSGRTNYLGTSASLVAHAEGSEPLFYQWIRNGNNLPGATNNILTISAVQQDDAGSYSLIVSNVYGVSTSSVVAMKVLSRPEIATQDGRLGFTNGQFGFNVDAVPGQKVLIEWSGSFVNWIPLQTNVLENQSLYFREPRSTKYPSSYYRVRVIQ